MPTLLGEVLDQHRVVGDLDVSLGGQRDLEALADARRLQQLLRLGEVLLALGTDVSVDGKAGANGLSLPMTARSAEQALHQQLAVEAERQRAAARACR